MINVYPLLFLLQTRCAWTCPDEAGARLILWPHSGCLPPFHDMISFRGFSLRADVEPHFL